MDRRVSYGMSEGNERVRVALKETEEQKRRE